MRLCAQQASPNARRMIFILHLFRTEHMARILLIDDEINLLRMTEMMLRHAGHDVTALARGKDALGVIEAHADGALPFDVVITDYRLNDVTGLDVLRAAKAKDSNAQVLLVTAYATTATAVEAMRCGAYDYIEKPFRRDELLSLVTHAAAKAAELRASQLPKIAADETPGLPNCIGRSAPMRAVLELARRVAPTKANILIGGESGTGKEVIARAIHRLSGVKGPFVAVNCGAIPESLVESEFFGYAKGAFTGANRDKAGFFQAASHGTLFLDEIGELAANMQVKLLRAIQEKKVQRVGSASEEDVSVRIIAATNRDLRAEVDAHRFREDLFFRLNVIQIGLPSLRDRKEDIPLLIRHFISKFNEELEKNIQSVSPEALAILMAYDYRGNVRELENIAEHAITLEQTPEITVSSLPAYLRNAYADAPEISAAAHDIPEIPKVGDDGVELENIVEDIERSLIEQSLDRTDGNITEAAKLLGLNFRSLRYRLKKYGIKTRGGGADINRDA